MSSRTVHRHLSVSIAALFCGALWVSSAVAQTAPAAPSKVALPAGARSPASGPMRVPPIRITADIPSPPPSGMEVFGLARSRPPVQFLDEKLKAAGLPALKLDRKNYVLRVTGASDHDRQGGLRAFVDMRSGDTEFVPNMREVVRTAEHAKPSTAQRAMAAAKAVYADSRFMPRDVTRLRIPEAIPVWGGQAGRSTTQGHTQGGKPLQVMTLVPAERYANGFKVYGTGSRSVVTFDADGRMIGAVRRWRTASHGERVRPRLTRDQVREDILRQLRPVVTTQGTSANVDKVELAYYDNNQRYLEPVYHFEATVRPADKRLSPIRVSGFIPFGPSREPIPDLAAKPRGETPTAAQRPGASSPGGIGKSPTPDDITLGEYANRDWPHDSGYVSMSNNFLSGLTFLNGIIPGITPPVTRTQWVEAWPWEVVGPWSHYYMNAVNVAYTVPHGDWLINTTLRNDSDLWSVPDIGTSGNPGYGAAASNGKLATWIIMSCEVIPSYYDRMHESGGSGNGYDAFNAWWPVFRGMHNAIAFRTIMFYPDNSLQWGFGYAASLGGDLNAAWFQEVAANEAGVGTYKSQHLAGGPDVHYDRASTMIDGRDLGQSIYAVAPQTPSSTLWNFWMGN